MGQDGALRALSSEHHGKCAQACARTGRCRGGGGGGGSDLQQVDGQRERAHVGEEWVAEYAGEYAVPFGSGSEEDGSEGGERPRGECDRIGRAHVDHGADYQRQHRYVGQEAPRAAFAELHSSGGELSLQNEAAGLGPAHRAASHLAAGRRGQPRPVGICLALTLRRRRRCQRGRAKAARGSGNEDADDKVRDACQMRGARGGVW